MRPGHPNILIVKLSAIGDVVHTLPALNALRRHYPGAMIAWVVEEAAAPLVLGHAAVDRVLVSRRKTWLRGLSGGNRREMFRAARAFVRDLRDTRYDLVLDFQASLKGALLIALARAKRKIGFGPGMAHQEHSYWVLNERIPMVSMEMHALDRGLALLGAIGVPCNHLEYHLPIDAETRRRAAALINAVPAAESKKCIAMNPVAQWESKLWPMDRFARLADHLVEDQGACIYFTGGRDDRAAIKGIIKAMHHPAENLAGRTSLVDLAALYQKMDCLISTDTGPMHIAAAVGTPVVALFGPTAEWRTGPYGPGHRVVTSSCACRPCFKRTCPTPGCMLDIGVEQVREQVGALLRSENKP